MAAKINETNPKLQGKKVTIYSTLVPSLKKKKTMKTSPKKKY